MQKTVILFLFLFISPFAKTQLIPWFFNTHTFKNWAIEKDIKTLVHISYVSQLNSEFSGFTHQAFQYYPNNESPEFVKLKADYTIFKFDSVGQVKSLTINACEIAYLIGNESDANTVYLKELMLKMASENQFPAKTITRERMELGSTIYSFRSTKIDSSVSDPGEGVRSAQEITYRESGINSYDENSGLRFSYDFTLWQVMEFNTSAPSKLTGYWYGGDFYEPIVNELSYLTENDSLYKLQFNGIQTTMYDYSAIDTSFGLNYSVIRSIRNRSALPDSVSKIMNLKPNDSIAFFTYLLPYRIHSESNLQIPIVENYKSSFKDGLKKTTFHSIYVNNQFCKHHKSPEICFPFEYNNYDNIYYLKLMGNWHYNPINKFVNLKTEELYYKTGELKKVEQFTFSSETNDWHLISTEKYEVDGRLKALKSYGGAGYIIPFHYLSERNDLGYLDPNFTDKKAEINYDEVGNFEITINGAQRIVKTTNTDLIVVTNNEYYSDSTFTRGQYFESQFLIIR